MRSSTLDDSSRRLLERYVPDYRTDSAEVDENSIIVFLAVLYQTDIKTVSKEIANVYSVYSKYYLVFRKLIELADSGEVLDYNYVISIYSTLFNVDTAAILARQTERQYSDLIDGAVDRLSELIKGESRVCDISVVSSVLYYYMRIAVTGNVYMDYIVGYLIVNYLLFYVGYRVAVPVYEASDVLNSILIEDIDPRIMKSLIGRKLLFGLDYVNSVLYD
jgi:hypothetical protein